MIHFLLSLLEEGTPGEILLLLLSLEWSLPLFYGEHLGSDFRLDLLGRALPFTSFEGASDLESMRRTWLGERFLVGGLYLAEPLLEVVLQLEMLSVSSSFSV